MSILALFLKSYWRQLVVVAALAALGFFLINQLKAYGERQYNKGQADSDKSWTDVWNDRVEKHNKAVDRLAEDSTKAKADLLAEAEARETRLNKIIEDLKKRNPNKENWNPGLGTTCTPPKQTGSQGHTGNVSSVDQAPVSKLLYDPVDGLLTVPLGDTFVDTWNKINATGFDLTVKPEK